MKKCASEEFYDAFPGGGGLVRECECGRVYFVDCPNADWDEDEFEDLMESHRSDPDNYVLINDDYVFSVNLYGSDYVYGCDCGLLAKEEEIIWRNRREIVRYLRKRSRKIMEDAQNEVAMVTGINQNSLTEVEKQIKEIREKWTM